MKTSFLTLLLCATALAGCSTTSMMNPREADSAQPAQTAVGRAPADSDDRALRGVLAFGFTGGGDTIVPVTFVDANNNPVGTSNIRAGSGAQISAGAEYRFNPTFAVQGTAGYQMDDAVGINGSLRFVRNPYELIGYARVYEGWRLGVGARIVEHARIRGEGVAQQADVNFERATGGVVELEYLFNQHAGVKVRYARESYQLTGDPEKISGNQAGVFINAYF